MKARVAAAVLASLACARAPVMPPAPEPVRAYADVNGVHMYYEIQGRGRPVLMMHGGIGGHSLWRETIAALAAHHRVIAPEMMGHGHTPDVPSREFSYAQMAQDTVALLERLQIAQVDVVGWSDGGIIGLILAVDHPGLVRRLVTSGANVDDEGIAPRKRGMRPEDLPPFLREAYALDAPEGAQYLPVFLSRIEKMWRRYPYLERSRLKEIRCPALIMAGDRDFIPQQQTIHIAQAIPGAQLLIVPGSSHGTFRERPGLVNLAVLEFLDAPER